MKETSNNSKDKAERSVFSGSLKYFGKRGGWYLATLLVAIALNFALPRFGPSNPIDTIMTKLSSPGMDSRQYLKLYDQYMKEFHLDKPLVVQFFHYLKMVLMGDLGVSFTHHPLGVSEILKKGILWTLALQLPAIILGWIIGNVLGVLAAYHRGIFDKILYPFSLFFSSIPYFCFAMVLAFLFAIQFEIFPPMGAYDLGLIPGWSWAFIGSLFSHYTLPFLSLLLILIGGQAIGMRSMAIYELGTDYVKYLKQMGTQESLIVRYIFRNAMLPQLTGLALSLGLMIGGALITEIVFSYPGLGMVLFNAIRENDYPVIQGCTLWITLGVLIANFVVDIIVGLVDPRVQLGEASSS